MSLPSLARSDRDGSSPSTVPPFQRDMSACYACFFVFELFDLIVRAVHGEGEGKRSVANLAVASKEFYAGATAVLWEEMDTLVPLLTLIPYGMWMQVRDDGNAPQRSQHLIHSQDWSTSRVVWYGQHIRRLVWSNDLHKQLPESQAVELLTYLPTTLKLLPNLLSFAWTEHRPAVSRLLKPKLFTNPLLQELSLDMALTDREPMATIFDVVRNTCPKLSRLRLTGDPSEPLDVAVSVALADLVRTARLVEFRCTSPLFDDVLLAVAESASLQYVDIKVNWYTLDDMVVSALPSRCLPSVRDLSLQFEALDASSLALLEKLGSTSLANLGIHITAEVYENDMLIKHLAVLTKAPFTSSLRKVELHCWRMDSEDNGCRPSIINLKILRPLLELDQLTHLIVYAKSFALTASDIRTIAQAFPRIQNLEFMPAFCVGTEPPLGALQHIVELCPELTMISMPVSAAFGVPTIRRGWKPRARVRMYTIVSPALDGGDPRIYAYISALFPERPPEQLTHEDASVTEEEKDQYKEYLKATRTPGESEASACSRAESWAQINTQLI